MNGDFQCVINAKNIYRNYVEVIDGEVQGYRLQPDETLVRIDPPIMRTHAGVSGFVSAPCVNQDTMTWVAVDNEQEIAAWEVGHPAPSVKQPAPTPEQQAIAQLMRDVAAIKGGVNNA